MKYENNMLEEKISNKKISHKLLIFSLPIIIASPVIPMIIIFAPPKIAHIFTAIFAIYCLSLLLIMTISLFFSPNKISRLVSIPMTFVMVLFGFIIWKLKLYLLLLNAFSLGEPFILEPKMIEEMMDLVFPLTMVGVWVTILPILFYIVRLFLKFNKKKDLTNAIKGQGYVKNVIQTQMKINKNRVYNIVLDIQPETGLRYIAKKDFIIPVHIIHTIALGNTVEVLIDSNNDQDFYIQTPYGLL